MPCPPPGDLPDPGIEPTSLMSPALAEGFFTISATLTVIVPPILTVTLDFFYDVSEISYRDLYSAAYFYVFLKEVVIKIGKLELSVILTS